MTSETNFGRFFLPGPTEVLPDVLAAMTAPMIGHRVPEMEALMSRIQPGMKYVFRTERPVYIAPSSGTGMMEAAVRNGALRRVLSLVNGAFSERFYRIAKANGLEADAVEVPWGEAHTPDMLESALRKGSYDAVTVCHSETSTGVLNPIGELAAVAHAAGDVAILVDSVSGMAGAPVQTDAWGLDFILTGSQKSFALPPGLAFGVAQASLLERAASKANRGVYFDFMAYEKNIQKNQTPSTPAVSLLYALVTQLEHIRAETVAGRWARHAAMAQRTYQWIAEMNDRGVPLGILAPEGYRSPTVTAVQLPESWTGPRLVGAVKERGFQVATGYGKLKETTFRIGHMGEHTVAELEALFGALEDVFRA